MNKFIAFWSILKKDMKNYYLKPPNISWGIIFPISWTLMFFVRSESAVDIRSILPGVMALSVLFGTTSMLAVTITFERRSRSLERLLLAPISLNLLMLAKTTGAIIFGVINAFIPVFLLPFSRPLRYQLAGSLFKCAADCRNLHLLRLIYCRLCPRGIRSTNILKLFPLPHDVSLWFVHPYCQLTCSAAAALLSTAPDLWC